MAQQVHTVSFSWSWTQELLVDWFYWFIYWLIKHIVELMSMIDWLKNSWMDEQTHSVTQSIFQFKLRIRLWTCTCCCMFPTGMTVNTTTTVAGAEGWRATASPRWTAAGRRGRGRRMRSRRIYDRSARTSPTSSAHTGLNSDFYNYYQCFGSGFIESGSGSSILGWKPILIQGFLWSKIPKNLLLKIFFIFFGSKIAIYLPLGLHKGCKSYRRSLQTSKEIIQHFRTWNFFYFCRSFLPSWTWIRISNPDPLSWLNPDPKHWLLYYIQFWSSKTIVDAFVKHSLPSPFSEKFLIC